MSLPDDVAKGARAHSLLTNAAFQEAFDGVRMAIHDKWEECPVRDKEGAHELRLMLKLLADVKAVLETAVEDGNAARLKLDEMNLGSTRRVLTPREWKGT